MSPALTDPWSDRDPRLTDGSLARTHLGLITSPGTLRGRSPAEDGSAK